MSHDNNDPAERRTNRPSVRSGQPNRKKKKVSKTAGKRKESAKKAVSGRKGSSGKESVSDSKSSQRKREISGKRMSKNIKSGDVKTTSIKETGDIKNEDFETRISRRDEERARRRAERERKVRRQKIIMAVSSCIILISIIGIVMSCLPSVKVSFRLFQGDRYAVKEDYVNAQNAFEKALAIDSASVKAYRGLADIFDIQGMLSEEEQILYTGWEQTQNEDLLHYYCVAVLNQAVAEINSRNCTLATVEKCIKALEQGKEDSKALELLAVCHERLFRVTEEEDTCTMFFDEDTGQDTCGYTEYEQLLQRIQVVYQARPSEEIKQILKQYAVIDMPYVRISMPHVESYMSLLTEINSTVNDADIAETLACLARAKEVQDYFDTAFDEFGAGNYAYARELVSDEAYQKIRDAFIEEDSGYWEGSVYIPVSREQLVLHREGENVRFFFLDDEEYENHQGIITVWGTQQEDDGVQRSVISYKPVTEPEADSYTEYTIQYLYSNVKIDGEYVPQMNYRIDTKTTTSEGVTTNAIGDWGGEHEWEIDY